MNDADQFRKITFGGPATYRITVQGSVPGDWGDRLAGMKLHIEGAGVPNEAKSVLEGLLRDQSELSGVLDTLYHLHLPIVRVEQVEDQD